MKKKLKLNSKSLTKISTDEMSEVQGGWWSGGCTDGCGGATGLFNTSFNCTNQSCTSDCSTTSCNTDAFCTAIKDENSSGSGGK